MNPITEYILKNLELDDEEEYVVEKSKDNKNVIRIFKDGKYVYLGSKYSVGREVNKLLEELKDINSETIIVIFGLAAGEQILNILESTKYNKIIVFEPDIAVIKTFLNIDYSRKILDDERFIISFYERNICKDIIINLIKETEANNVKVLYYANYNEIFKEEFNEFFKVCVDVIEKCLINIGTEIYFSKKMIEVYLNNMKNVIKSTPINFYKNIAKDMPAIVVSAGPSLSKNIHKLKKAKDKFIIICGARTLKPLLDVGITPDYICIIDPVDLSFEFIKDCKDYNATMVFCGVSNFKTVDFYKGKKAVFNEFSIFGDMTNKIINYDIDSLWNGGSVAHTCMSFADYLGCKTIIFIGQDLAYTNNKQHDDKADFFGGNNENLQQNKKNIYVEDIYGKKVLTSKVLNFYRKNFEDYISRFHNIKFINATEGGANIEGTEIMLLDEVLDKYDKCSKQEVKLNGEFKGFDRKAIINNLESISNQLEQINKRCKKHLEVIKNMEKEEVVINTQTVKLLKGIKNNNAKIEKISILNSLINPTLNRVVANPEYRENQNDNSSQKIKKIIEQTKILYDDATESIKYLNPMLKKLIDELKRGDKDE